MFESEFSSNKIQFKDLPKVTTVIVIVNVCLFILCTFTGPLLYNIGSVGLAFMDSPKSIYRIFTSMFLHADVNHIFSNMVLLAFLGDMIEKKMGSIRFTIVYFFSGICGCLLTFVYEFLSGRYVRMIGASGAVFGLFGTLLALVLFKRINKQTMQIGRVFVVIVFFLFEGFTNAEIANFAHLGGALAGFLAGVIYCIFTNK